MNRFSASDVSSLFTAPRPRGLVDLWNAVPHGHSADLSGLISLRRSNQQAIVQGLALAEQQALAAIGSTIGFRPEVFEQLRDLPGVDVLAAVAEGIVSGNFDLGALTSSSMGLMVDILEHVGEIYQASLAVVEYAPAIAQSVALVWNVVSTIVDAERNWRAAQDASKAGDLDCTPLAYSASVDEAQIADVLGRLRADPVWDDIFLPAVRPALGFTCCPSTLDGSRVIAPVGTGIGNRQQSAVGHFDNPVIPSAFGDRWGYGVGIGFGCLPMCPDLLVHRAIFAAPNGTYSDPANVLAQLGGLGTYVWRVLWGGGPATFAVDGYSIADAWANYLRVMRDQLLFNRVLILGGWTTGHGTFGEPICGTWPIEKRRGVLRWLYQRIGGAEVVKAADHDGVYLFDQAWPVAGWRKFNDLQSVICGINPVSRRAGFPRPVVAYVDSRSCSPAWRQRVYEAQSRLLEAGDAVCKLDLDSIPDPEYLAAVQARRQEKGFVCYGVGGMSVAAPRPTTAADGPSLEPLGEGSPSLPEIPSFPHGSIDVPITTGTVGRRGSGGKTLVKALGGAAVGLGLLKLLRR